MITAPLESSGLLNHPIFVPLMLNSALFSRQNTTLYTLSGKNTGPTYSGGSDQQPLKLQIADEQIIPRQRNRGNRIELYNLPPKSNLEFTR
ncbi:MAG: hypothetical protein U5L96_02710 [Owenweeksia sp.]|nr:hypothetical protein [Owenweeksia sp.]